MFSDALTVVDLVDLAVDAVYQFYHKILRDDTVLDTVLTHSLQKVTRSADYITFVHSVLGVPQSIENPGFLWTYTCRSNSLVCHPEMAESPFKSLCVGVYTETRMRPCRAGRIFNRGNASGRVFLKKRNLFSQVDLSLLTFNLQDPTEQSLLFFPLRLMRLMTFSVPVGWTVWKTSVFPLWRKN